MSIPTAVIDHSTCRLANGVIELTLSSAGRVERLTHAASGFSFEPDPAGAAFWSVTLRGADSRLRVVEPAGECRVAAGAGEGRAGAELHWPEGPLGVTVRVRLDRGSPVSFWRIEVENRTDEAIWQVDFPRLAGLGKLAGVGERDRLAFPFLWGALAQNPVDLLAHGELVATASDFAEYSAGDSQRADQPRIAYSYPGMMTMQMLAFYNPDRAGLYFGAHDPRANFKRFGAYGEAGREQLDLILQNFPEERIQPSLDYWLPYPAVVGAFAGEWWRATGIYRAWAIEQEWCAKGPLHTRKDIPQWIKDMDLWYWNYVYRDQHSPEEIVPAVRRLQERMGVKSCIHWYEWNDWPFNDNIPECFPMTHEWRERLAQGLAELHAAGAHAIPYTNARLWDCDTLAYRTEGGAESAVLDERGRPTPWGKGPAATWLAMCPSARPWQEKMVRLMKEIVEQVGMDGAYLDQITSSFVLPCFVAEHGHSRGGGDSWYRGYRQMMNMIRAAVNTKRPDVIWTSEDVIECYLDLFDTNLSRHGSQIDGRFGDEWLPIPMFASVYHDYAMTYGTVQTMDQPFDDAYYFGEALVFAGGSQPMICGYFAKHLGTDAFKGRLDYLERLARIRQRARAFLTYGRWLAPVEIETEETEVKWSDDAPAKRVPAVVATSWAAPDGRVAIVMVNHTDRTQHVRYAFHGGEYGLAGGTLTLAELIASGEQLVADGLPAAFKREATLPPHSPAVFVASRGPMPPCS